MTLEEVRMNPDTQTLYCHSRGVPTDGAGAALRSCYTQTSLGTTARTPLAGMSNCTEQTNAPLGEGGNAITSMGNFTSDDAKDTSYCRGYGAKYRANALVMTLPPCDISLLCCCV